MTTVLADINDVTEEDEREYMERIDRDEERLYAEFETKKKMFSIERKYLNLCCGLRRIVPNYKPKTVFSIGAHLIEIFSPQRLLSYCDSR
jgi:hypothetical protein